MRYLTSIAVIFFYLWSNVALAQEGIKLAVIAAKTGDASTSNAAMFQAARFTVDQLNASGGVLGMPVTILEFDNKSTAIGSAEAAQQAVAAGVDGVIGASWSSHSIAMAPILQKAHIPMISPISTNPDVTLQGEYIFRVCYTDPFQGQVMAKFARDTLHAKTAVVLVNVSRKYSLGLADYFEKNFVKLGGKVVWRADFLIDVTDYNTLLERIKEIDPDVLYMPGDYRDSAYVIKQAKTLHLRSTLLGGDAFGLRLYALTGSDADGSYYTTHWHRDDPNPLSQQFIKQYESVYKEIQQTTVPLTYDAIMLYAHAVRQAGTKDTVAVQKALAKTTVFHGVTGDITFDEHGDPIKSVVIAKLFDGKVQFINSVFP